MIPQHALLFGTTTFDSLLQANERYDEQASDHRCLLFLLALEAALGGSSCWSRLGTAEPAGRALAAGGPELVETVSHVRRTLFLSHL